MEHIFLGERVPLSSPLVIFMLSRTDVFNSEPECVEQTHEILNNKFEKLSAILSMFLILKQRNKQSVPVNFIYKNFLCTFNQISN